MSNHEDPSADDLEVRIKLHRELRAMLVYRHPPKPLNVHWITMRWLRQMAKDAA